MSSASKRQAKSGCSFFVCPNPRYNAAFGKAATPMLRFYDQLYHGIELYSQHLGTRCPAWTYHTIHGKRRKHLSDPFQFLGFLYPPNLLSSLETGLAQAGKTADTDKVKVRLALVRREFDYAKILARVIHLYHAYQIQPDLASRDHLLDAIVARNSEIDGYYDTRGDPGQAATGRSLCFHPAATTLSICGLPMTGTRNHSRTHR